jgi:uncharacterized phage protein gp47/JayE
MSLAAQITPTGISAPSYEDILASLTLSFQTIYGVDSYLGPDSQDGQLLAVFAAAINDVNQMAVATYNSFSPSTAQGVGLSSVVKINGLARLVASNSTVDVIIVGQAGTVISNGVIADSLGNNWNLPTTVTIPIGGSITVTATAAVQGALTAAPNTITTIATPTRGWQTVTNPSAAIVGQPVEDDATLRSRQSVSTSLPALSVIDAIVAAIGNIPGMQRYKVYENATGTTDGNGIPAHSISAVTEGGDVQVIGNTIASKKTPGTGTYGTTSITVVDSEGISSTIHFFTLAEIVITVEVDITALAGYVSTTGTSIIAAIATAISSLDIGTDVYYTKLFTAANLNGSPLSSTYNVTAIKISRDGNPVAPSDVVIAFNEAAISAVNNISLVVT